MKGKSYILSTYQSIESLYAHSSTKESKNSVCEIFYSDYEVHLKPYFSILIQILLKIDNSPLNNKKDYIDILKAQLSDCEFKMVGMLLNSDFIDERLSILATKYSIQEFQQ